MSEKLYTIKEVANAIGRDRSITLRNIKKYNIPTVMIRTPETNGQQTVALTEESYQQLLDLKEEYGGNGKRRHISPKTEKGFFYLIAPIPEYSKNRIKLGYTFSMEERIKEYKTICPTMEIIKKWPIKKYHERTIMDAAITKNDKRIGMEIYEIESIDKLISRIDLLIKMISE